MNSTMKDVDMTSHKRGWQHYLAPHGWRREFKIAAIWSLVILVFLAISVFVLDDEADAATQTGAVVAIEEPGDESWYEVETDAETVLLDVTCGDICGTKSRSAAQKFRDGDITRASGFSPSGVFKSPSAAKDVYVAKFRRLIHRRWHSTSLLREFAMDESGAPCTADTRSCAVEWYERSIDARCRADNAPFPADSDSCTENVSLPQADRYTEENIKNTGAVFFCAGGIGLAIGTGGGFGAFWGGGWGCWSTYWVLHNGG